MSELLFTPAAVLDLLVQIDELSDYDISLVERSEEGIDLRIGHSDYFIVANQAEDVIVDKSIVDEVEDIHLEAYEDISEHEDMEIITSGIIKEVFNTLLVGGLVRLTTKLLK